MQQFKGFKYLVLYLFICSYTMSCQTDPYENNFIKQQIYGQDNLVDRVLDNPDQYKLQILYTQIDRDSLNQPSFSSYEFRVDDQEYFYPASTVKMPAAILALQKLKELNIPDLTRDTQMLTDSAFSGQTSVSFDSTSKGGFPSIAHYIKKIFLVSDNDAYNRLYELLGQEYLNGELQARGYANTRLTHRLSIFLTQEENQTTNPVRFYENDSLVYEKPLIISQEDYTFPDPILLGKGYIKDGNRIDEPMDFREKNSFPVEDMQMMLKRVLFPEEFDQSEQFNLREEDYQFLYKYMSMLPGESDYPAYDSVYYDSYVKFFMFGDQKEPMPTNIRIFNKVGDAYGFLTDNAYIVDFDSGIEFLLTAVIQVNENQVYNDGNYEYDQIGFPFLSRLGTLIYNYEKGRPRKHAPDLSKFSYDYSN